MCASLVNRSKKSLEDWIKRIESGELLSVDRHKIEFPLVPSVVEKVAKKLGDFSDLNKRWSTSNSSNTKSRLDKNNEEWYYCHTLYRQARESWSEIPYIEISKKIMVRPDWIVGDFGCGENLLSKEITNKVYSFDYVSIDDSVVSCDITNVPLDDNSLDAAVFSLSLMGSNYTDYLKEAYRVVKSYGQIFICEPQGKWEGKESELKSVMAENGFKTIDTKITSKFIYIEGIKIG